MDVASSPFFQLCRPNRLSMASERGVEGKAWIRRRHVECCAAFSSDGAKCSNSTQQLGARLCIFEMAHSWLALSRRMTRRLKTKKPFLVGMVANHVADSLIPNGIQRHSLPARFAELPALNSVPHLVRIIKRFVTDCKETAFPTGIGIAEIAIWRVG